MTDVYFIGIGGIGMSAIARYFKFKGLRVSGYDRTPSPLTDRLQAEGIEVHFKDDVSCIPEDVSCGFYKIKIRRCKRLPVAIVV